MRQHYKTIISNCKQAAKDKYAETIDEVIWHKTVMMFNLTLDWLDLYTVKETALLVINECKRYDPDTPERKTLEFINDVFLRKYIKNMMGKKEPKIKLITKEQLALSNIVIEDDLLKTIPEGGLTLTEFSKLDLLEEDILKTLLNTASPQQKRKLIYLWAARYIERAEYYSGVQPTIVMEALMVLKRLSLSYRPRHNTIRMESETIRTQLSQKETVGHPSKPENRIIQILINALQEDEHEAALSTAIECAKLTYTLRGTCDEDTYGVLVADTLKLLNKGK